MGPGGSTSSHELNFQAKIVRSDESAMESRCCESEDLLTRHTNLPPAVHVVESVVDPGQIFPQVFELEDLLLLLHLGPQLHPYGSVNYDLGLFRIIHWISNIKEQRNLVS